jgi:hypothetical protein
MKPYFFLIGVILVLCDGWLVYPGLVCLLFASELPTMAYNKLTRARAGRLVMGRVG